MLRISLDNRMVISWLNFGQFGLLPWRVDITFDSVALGLRPPAAWQRFRILLTTLATRKQLDCITMICLPFVSISLYQLFLFYFE